MKSEDEIREALYTKRYAKNVKQSPLTRVLKKPESI